LIPSLELLKPSEELAYVIGVKVGDGYAYRRRLMKRLKRDAGRIPKGLLEGLMRRGIGGPS
jgi:hypothetical protein